MTLEQMEARWMALDEKLKRQQFFEKKLLQQVAIQASRSRLHCSLFWPMVDIGFCAVLLLGLGSFLARYWEDSRIWLPVGVVFAGTLGLLVSTICYLLLYSELDWTLPLTHVQTTLEHMRLFLAKQFQWTLLLAPLTGFCLLFLILYGLISWNSQGQINLFDMVSSYWIVINYIFGVLFMPAAYWLCQWLSKKYRHRSWWQLVIDGISGSAITQTQKVITRWISLENNVIHSGARNRPV
ncbi:MAG TPA: hypothetical protein PKA06_05970 [Gemmatales bacterium]|nr:hypothetical protein [Gemmatales bacterium]HMP16457.1 hypothetical protein [Gemmatales bacterium]